MSRIALTAVLVALGVAGVVAQAPRPTFDVASVKKQLERAVTPPPASPPGVFYRRNATVSQLIRFAFDIQDFQMTGGPDWINTDGFEIDARAGRPASQEEMRPMVLSLLEDRFKLVVRHEPRDGRFLALIVARTDGRLGPKMLKCDPDSPPKDLAVPVSLTTAGFLEACGPVSRLTALVSTVLQQVVVDETGLTGVWTMELRYQRPTPLRTTARPSPFDQDVPAIGAALQEQLGLRLEERTGPVEMLVIDSVQQPTEN